MDEDNTRHGQTKYGRLVSNRPTVRLNQYPICYGSFDGLT
ncbi:MAG: hypothetical protein WDN66_00400 [Candidatus Saccharibacteria bacterium]